MPQRAVERGGAWSGLTRCCGVLRGDAGYLEGMGWSGGPLKKGGRRGARRVCGMGESSCWMWRVHVDRLVWSDGSDQSGWLSKARRADVVDGGGEWVGAE